MYFKTKQQLVLYLKILTLSILLGCSKEDECNDDTFFDSKVILLGHRGMGELYKMPGNTYESISPAIAIGLDGCEIDIQMTKDTVLVLYHDETLNKRTTCVGKIYESNWDEIKHCKYYAVQNNIFINSLDELFARIPNLTDLYFSFDCSKVDNTVDDIDHYRAQYLRAIKRVCEKYTMTDHVFLEGDHDLMVKAKEMGLKNKMFLFSIMDQNAVNSCVESGFDGISTSIDWLYVDTDVPHQNGLYVMVWSPNNESQNRYALENGVEIIQTDNPISILKLLGRFNYEYVIP